MVSTNKPPSKASEVRKERYQRRPRDIGGSDVIEKRTGRCDTLSNVSLGHRKCVLLKQIESPREGRERGREKDETVEQRPRTPLSKPNLGDPRGDELSPRAERILVEGSTMGFLFFFVFPPGRARVISGVLISEKHSCQVSVIVYFLFSLHGEITARRTKKSVQPGDQKGIAVMQVHGGINQSCHATRDRWRSIRSLAKTSALHV